MRVDDAAQVAMWAPQARFDYVKSPFFIWSDSPWQSGPAMLERNDGFISDYDLQVVYPRPLRVPVNLRLKPGIDTPYDQDWARLQPPSGDQRHYFRSLEEIEVKPSAEHDAPYNDVFKVNYTPLFTQFGELNAPISTRAVTMAMKDTKTVALEAALSDTYGITVYALTLFQQQTENANGGNIATTNPSEDYELWIGVTIGAGEDAIDYAIRSEANTDVGIYRRAAGEADFGLVQRLAPGNLNISAGVASTYGGFPGIPIDFRVIAGRLQIRLGDSQIPAYFDESRINNDGEPISKITRVWWRHRKLNQVVIHLFKLKWPSADVSLISSEIPIGFYSESFEGARIDAAGPDADAWEATVDTENSELTGPIVIYKLDFDGPNDGSHKGQQYSDAPFAVRSVDLIWSPVVKRNPSFALYPRPEGVEVTHAFNPGDLTIRSSGSLFFSNNKPQIKPTGENIFWGEWMANYGQVALEIALQRTITGIPNSLSVPFKVFTGYGHTRGEVHARGGSSQFVMHFEDRVRQIRSPRFALPWMDGWNIYYAFAYLAQLGGVSIEDLAFKHLVPPVPFGEGSDLGNGEGGGAYYLPVGAAGAALTRFSGLGLWEIMGRMAFAIGYMRFFNVNGQLDLRKFRIPSGVRRFFYESDRASGGLEGCWEVHAAKDMDEVRSEVVIVGIDAFAPKWEPIGVKYSNDGIIYNPRQVNHLGYSDPFVWIDSQFADPHYADEAGFETMRFLQVPGFDVTLTTWLQPDIFPLDMIVLQSFMTGSAWTRLAVMQIKHTKFHDGPGSSIITGRLIPA